MLYLSFPKIASVPPRRQHATFLEEIAAFVRGHASMLNGQDLECWPPSFSTPLMQTYLRTLYLRKDRFAEWYINLTSGYVTQPDQTPHAYWRGTATCAS